eukprot:1156454-Pelagomonas_calceolata.AAC.7
MLEEQTANQGRDTEEGAKEASIRNAGLKQSGTQHLPQGLGSLMSMPPPSSRNTCLFGTAAQQHRPLHRPITHLQRSKAVAKSEKLGSPDPHNSTDAAEAFHSRAAQRGCGTASQSMRDR